MRLVVLCVQKQSMVELNKKLTKRMHCMYVFVCGTINTFVFLE